MVKYKSYTDPRNLIELPHENLDSYSYEGWYKIEDSRESADHTEWFKIEEEYVEPLDEAL